MLPGGMAQAMGLRSMGQLIEPGPDPDSRERLLVELLTDELIANQTVEPA
jgi:hypothetical protein